MWKIAKYPRWKLVSENIIKRRLTVFGASAALSDISAADYRQMRGIPMES